MSTSSPHPLSRFLPHTNPVSTAERLRIVAGSVFAVAALCAIGSVGYGFSRFPVWLLAPFGASTVLIFAAPTGPFAHPWAVIVGNVLCAAVGMACATWIPNPAFAMMLGMAIAMLGMILTRSLHPPGGAMMLLPILAQAKGQPFPLEAVFVGSVCLVCAGLVYHRLGGRTYPMPHPAHLPQPPASVAPFLSDDLDAVLRRYNHLLDVDPDELEILLQAVEEEALQRRQGESAQSNSSVG
jgi:CBS domain-containing membrane protein